MTNSGSEANDKKNIEFERFVDSTNTMLGCVGNKMIEACSISIVPDHLRESNKDAYIPKVVSIGPLHRRSRTSLMYMEETKWRCMVYLLHRTKDPKESLRKCSEDLYKFEEVFRASYVDDLKSFDTYDFVKILLLDGCFLLELLISNNKELNTKLKRLPPNSSGIGIETETSTSTSSSASSSASTGPGIEVAKMDEVLSDLLLLENQIPLLVINRLSTILFPDDFTEGTSKKSVTDLVLCLYGYSGRNVNTNYSAAHLLELVHSFATGELGERDRIENEINNSRDGEVKLAIIGENEQAEDRIVGKKSSHGKLKLISSATKLQAAGVTIESKLVRKYGIGFEIDINFNAGILKIPQLHITGTTEAKWRNFIAWEHTRNDRARFVPSFQECKFSCYALVIRNLIGCVHDIQLLKNKNVMFVYDDAYTNQEINQDGKKKKKLSNRDLKHVIKNISEGVGDGDENVVMGSSFHQLFQDLNNHRSKKVNRFKVAIFVLWHSFRCLFTRFGYKCQEWYAILRKEYTPTMWKTLGVVSAIVVLLLTITQFVLKAVTM